MKLIHKVMAALLLATYAAPAMASENMCYDLWQERNSYYHAAGYCFKTTLAQDRFGNENCKFSNIEDVPLSSRDRREIADIVRQEKALRCSN